MPFLILLAILFALLWQHHTTTVNTLRAQKDAQLKIAYDAARGAREARGAAEYKLDLMQKDVERLIRQRDALRREVVALFTDNERLRDEKLSYWGVDEL